MNPVQLNIKTTKEQVALLTGAIQQKIESLKDQATLIEKEISDLELLLMQLNVPYISPKTFSESASLAEYSTIWPFSRKAEYVIEKFGRPLSTTEIADHIKTLEPNLHRPVIVRNLSVVFANQKQRFKRTQTGDGETYVYSVIK